MTAEIEKQTAATLETLAGQINEEHRAFVGAFRKTLEHGIRCGELLASAKEQCPHGTWLDWLEQHFEGSVRTAQEYLRLYHNRAEVRANTRDSAYLGVSGALKQLAAPTRPEGIPSEEWAIIKPAMEWPLVGGPEPERLATLDQERRRGWVAQMAWAAMLEQGREYSDLRDQVHDATGPTEDLGVVDPDLLTEFQAATAKLRWWVGQVEWIESIVRACDYPPGRGAPTAAHDERTKEMTLTELHDDASSDRGDTTYPYPLQSPRGRIREFCGAVV